MQTVQTTRFGKIEVDEQRMILFPDGLLGFAKQKEFILLEDKKGSAFFWLQSVDVPDLAFVLTNPLSFKPDYIEALSAEEQTHFKSEHEKMVLFGLVTVPQGHPEGATINLLGPLVIDSARRIGKQVILANSGYTHRYPLFRS